jgi:hypothetical protein
VSLVLAWVTVSQAVKPAPSGSLRTTVNVAIFVLCLLRAVGGIAALVQRIIVKQYWPKGIGVALVLTNLLIASLQIGKGRAPRLAMYISNIVYALGITTLFVAGVIGLVNTCWTR